MENKKYAPRQNIRKIKMTEPLDKNIEMYDWSKHRNVWLIKT